MKITNFAFSNFLQDCQKNQCPHSNMFITAPFNNISTLTLKNQTITKARENLVMLLSFEQPLERMW